MPVFLFLRFATLATLIVPLFAQQRDVAQMIQKSVAANRADFDAAPQFNYKETDREGKGSKTYQVTMISGTPYNRLIAVNGKPLSKSQQEQEQQKQRQEISRRRSESASERERRIAKFDKDRKRDHAMMEQLTKAFDFTYVGEREERGFKVWILKAKPRRGYQPPNLETQVLPGMQGQLWIDQKTYQWVKVTAEVVRPVSIVGFLAKVEPGTQFEMEMSPVEGNIWQISHFSMRSRAKILGMINRRSEENSSYFDYRRANDSGK